MSNFTEQDANLVKKLDDGLKAVNAQVEEKLKNFDQI